MIYLTIVIAAVLVFVLQARIYRKYAFDKLEYKVTLSSDEVFEGDEVYVRGNIKQKIPPSPVFEGGHGAA